MVTVISQANTITECQREGIDGKYVQNFLLLSLFQYLVVVVLLNCRYLKFQIKLEVM